MDSYRKQRTIDGNVVNMDILDACTADPEFGGEQIRTSMYSDIQLFFICFSLDDVTSFENVKTKWLPEVKSKNPSAFIIIVGTKSDLRDIENPPMTLTKEQGENLATEISAMTYLEISSKTDKWTVDYL